MNIKIHNKINNFISKTIRKIKTGWGKTVRRKTGFEVGGVGDEEEKREGEVGGVGDEEENGE